MLLLTGLVAGVALLLVQSVLPGWKLVHYPLHASVETVGAFAAVIVALFILRLRRHGYLGSGYVWVASALLGMGVLDGLHALTHAGDRFVWLHSLAMFAGGTVFVLIWGCDRCKLAEDRKSVLPLLSLALAGTIGAWAVFLPETLPDMMDGDDFSVWAQAANILGSLGFLGASAYFAFGHTGENMARHRSLFASLCFLFGLSGAIFEFSAIWDAAWWLWHLLRVGAYMIAIAFYFRLTGNIERELIELKGSLERQVEVRTAALQVEVDMRRATDEELRKFARAVEQSPNMVFITDLDGAIQYVNPRFLELTGYTASEVVGRTPRVIKSPDTDPAVHKDIWDSILAGRVWRGEIKDRCKDGSSFWAEAVISPIRDPKGRITHFVAMHDDITDRKVAEIATQEARHMAEIANRAKTEFLSSMSHELRTPLNAIIGFSSLLLDGPLACQEGKHREYLDHINSSGQHLLELINDILDVSAIEAGSLNLQEEEVDIGDIVEASVRIVLPRAEASGVTVAGLAEGTYPRLRADARRLKQVLLNLLSNAVKFTPAGGAVACAAEIDPDGWLAVTVSDNGIGMTRDQLAIALTRFGQVDSSLARKHEGTGLGLPLTKGLVEAHGGEFRIASEKGKGTKACFRLPPDRLADVAADASLADGDIPR